jgi:hypothetical protein
MNIGFISFALPGRTASRWKWPSGRPAGSDGPHLLLLRRAVRPAGRTLLGLPAAFYQEPEMLARHQALFSRPTRTPEETAWVQQWRVHFHAQLHQFVRVFNLDLIIPQNVLAIPLNIPLALALADLIAETGIPTIAQHHDLAWERKRFLVNGVGDYLSAAFPPDLPPIQHVVINSLAQRQLAWRRGLNATLIPNVMDLPRRRPARRLRRQRAPRFGAGRRRTADFAADAGHFAQGD